MFRCVPPAQTVSLGDERTAPPVRRSRRAMVVRDETGASAPTLLLLERLREYVELAARLRSAAPLQLVAHCLTAPELSVTRFVAQHQLDERLQRALLQAGVNPSDPLPEDAEERLATALLSLAQQAEAPMGVVPMGKAFGRSSYHPGLSLPMGVASGVGAEAGSAARAQAEARAAAAEQAAAAANAELQLLRGALQRQTSALDEQQRTLDQQREGLQAAHGLQAECEHLRLQLAAASGGGGGGEAAAAAAAAAASRRELEAEMRRRCGELEAEVRAVAAERDELQQRLGRLEPLLERLEATSEALEATNA